MNRINNRSALTRAALILSTLAALSSCAPDENVGPRGSNIASNVEPLEQRARAAVEREWFVTKLPRDATPLDRFGHFVGLSGNTAVVSARVARAAYVFVRSDDGWHEQAKLEPPMDARAESFGDSVAISGDTIVVGGLSLVVTGEAYVYVRSGTSWSAPVTLSADDGIPLNDFGRSVAISGDTIVVGATAAHGVGAHEGAAYVFTREGSAWTQTSKLIATSDNHLNNWFGWSVAISGTNILVGAPKAPDGDGPGQAYFFTRSGADWNGQKVALAVTSCCDFFGFSVAVDGDIAVVGAPSHGGRLAGTTLGGDQQGAAFVYTRSTSGWTQETDGLFADDAENLDGLGYSIALSGSKVMVGAPGEGLYVGGADTVYFFDLLLGHTVQHRIGTRGERPYFGRSLALESDTAVIGTGSGNGAYVAELLLPDGSPCDSNSDCNARHCVEGICCNAACSGACEACETGTCVALPQDPGTPSCSPYLCGESGGGCPMRCESNGNCVDTNYCHDHQCVERLPTGGGCTEARGCVSGNCSDGACAGADDIGSRCSNAADCESGNCVDGFCCDQRCRGQCEACDLRGKHGICSPVSGAPRGARAPCEGPDTVCGGECDGEHTVGCDYPTISTGCGTSCADGLQTDSVCNGQGECEALEPHSCENFACADELVCKTTCERSTDCVPGHTCQNGRCEASATCLDAHTSQGTDGMEQNCSPYLCDEGSCRTTCETSEDCIDDAACNGNDCVPRPARNAASTNDGGGCSIARRSSSRVPWAAWALAAAAGLSMRIGSRKRRRASD